MMRAVSVECRNIGVAYGSTAVLREVDLCIDPGEFFGLLGPSGSGKSTLLRLIAGFVRADQGQVRINGEDVSARPPWQRRVGLVFQNYALWPHLNVWDNVAFGLVEQRLGKTEIRQRVGAILELVALSGLAQRRPSQLSGGQQQRVALARTLVTEPQVLLLDEPLSNLDRSLRQQMREELLTMQRRLGITTIFVTHDQEEAMASADRMAVLEGGRVRQIGSPIDLYDRPRDAFVAGFVGTMNLLPVTVQGHGAGHVRAAIEDLGHVELALGALADPDARVVGPSGSGWVLGLRPQAIQIADSSIAVPKDGLHVRAKITGTEFFGAHIRYRAQVGSHTLIIDEPRLARSVAHGVGDAVQLRIDTDQMRLLPA